MWFWCESSESVDFDGVCVGWGWVLLGYVLLGYVLLGWLSMFVFRHGSPSCLESDEGVDGFESSDAPCDFVAFAGAVVVGVAFDGEDEVEWEGFDDDA